MSISTVNHKCKTIHVRQCVGVMKREILVDYGYSKMGNNSHLIKNELKIKFWKNLEEKIALVQQVNIH